MHQLGILAQNRGDWVKAREYLQRALQIFEKHLGKDHPNVATVVNSLVLVLQALGDLAGARECFQRALHLLRAKLLPDHPYIRTVEENLLRMQ